MLRTWMALAAVAFASCSDATAPESGSATSTSGREPATTLIAVGTLPADPTTSVTTTSTSPPSRLDGPVDAITLTTGFDAAFATALDPTSPPTAVADAGVRLQLLLRALANHADLDATVLAGVGPQAAPVLQRIVAARQFGQAKAAADPTPSAPPATLPSWTIVEPVGIDQLRSYYDEAEAATGVPWYWLAAINLQETRMGRIAGVSSAGAVGPMQFLPSTWADCCTGDPTDTHDAIIGAATYLARSGAPADMAAAVHQYNPNDSYVLTVTAYAESLRDAPALLGAFHAWQVFTSSTAGTVRLPIGYSADAPVDAATYLAAHPDDAA